MAGDERPLDGQTSQRAADIIRRVVVHDKPPLTGDVRELAIDRGEEALAQRVVDAWHGAGRATHAIGCEPIAKPRPKLDPPVAGVVARVGEQRGRACHHAVQHLYANEGDVEPDAQRERLVEAAARHVVVTSVIVGAHAREAYSACGREPTARGVVSSA